MVSAYLLIREKMVDLMHREKPIINHSKKDEPMSIAKRAAKALGPNTALTFVSHFGQPHTCYILNASTGKQICAMYGDTYGGAIVETQYSQEYCKTLSQAAVYIKTLSNFPKRMKKQSFGRLSYKPEFAYLAD